MGEAIPKAVKDMWDKWNIRGLVIFSLVLQAILVLLSPNRKRTQRGLIQFLIWSAYLLANWSADYAVGQISDSSGDKPEPQESPKTNELVAFWTMFLLLHLGGPDTITALALEDNELWLRSLFGLMCQFIATLYIFLLSIPNRLWEPTTLMLVAGVLKYVERIGGMRAASLERFKKLMPGEPEPGVDYSSFMEEYKIREISREHSEFVRVEEPEERQREVRPHVLTQLHAIQYGYKYFNIYKGLVVDFLYSSEHWIESKEFFQSLEAVEALSILEVELSFIYGTLFTKVDILHTWTGVTFRFISLGCLFSSLSIFKTSRKDEYDGFDVGLTYALILGGIAFDFISILMFYVSDWTFARMSKPKEEVDDPNNWLEEFLTWFLRFKELKWNKCMCHEKEYPSHMILDRLFIFRRWSEYVYGYNLIGSSLRIKPKRIHHTKGYIHKTFDTIIRSLYIDRAIGIIIRETVLLYIALNHIYEKIYLYISYMFIENRVMYYVLDPPLRLLNYFRFWFVIPLIKYLWEFFSITDQLNEIIFTSRERLTTELWQVIFEEVQNKCRFVLGSESSSYIYSARGGWILRDMKIDEYYENLLPYITDVDYDQSILVWHIATELLHQTDDNNARHDVYREVGKTLSDYMMYLVIVKPSLMSTVSGIDKLRFKAAIAEIKRLQEAKKLFERTPVEGSRDAKTACNAILDYYKADGQGNENPQGYRSKSVLFQASMLAQELQRIEIQISNKKMWEVVSKVWVEMLSYAAKHCDPKQHAAQLNIGGELISFVWLLMAHFGLGHQFRTTKEDSRARLVLDKTTTSCLV
ncbi:PREDICTED: uncharacterized protein LOC104731663 [Camelina sativa]|uniref:Uncharacterized protein LOC104731663 n=1 Tax=Camelina sativa TaxID=90675 RepID=A0ABM0V1H5_CAMSA|nr:PREDICTED: uncharacterized protein LOC104731663 [Camelina sativa]